MSEIQFPKNFVVDVDKLEAVRTDEGHIWGWEKWLVNDELLDLCCKMLKIYPGFRSSKHAHQTIEDRPGKCEYFQVLSGELKLHVWADGKDGPMEVIILEAGMQYYIPREVYHRFETGTKQFVLLLEISTFENEQTHKLKRSKRL